jgi:hypothetical protein
MQFKFLEEVTVFRSGSCSWRDVFLDVNLFLRGCCSQSSFRLLALEDLIKGYFATGIEFGLIHFIANELLHMLYPLFLSFPL